MSHSFRNTVEVIMFSQGKLLVVKRSSKAKIAPSCWHVPAGKAKYDETPEQAAIREVLEETNIQLTHVEPLFVRPFQGTTVDGERYYRCIFTYAAHVTHTSMLQLNDEHSDYAWVTLQQLAAPQYASFDQQLYQIIADNMKKARAN